MSRTSRILPAVLAASVGISMASGAYSQSADTSADASANAQASQSADIKLAQADRLAEVERELRARGYKIIKEGRTLLGRYYVRAKNEVHVREVVVHQRTGEVLSDVAFMLKGGNDQATEAAAGEASQKNQESSGGSGSIGVSTGGSVSVNVGSSVGVSVGGGSVDISVGGSSDTSAEGSMGGGLGLGN
ncbi:hypothetical protein [Nitrobacter sp. Nb-311A]|uniref:hypothetical protein n=1 Tax=Nitrobacter sp. Nb-311A TaxID=314253 RepID=UPI000324C1FA|nr:hypothetical protein [Nitrobacter sp. Nb-311A]